MVAYCSWTFAFSTAARSDSTVASSAAAAVRVVSTCSFGGDAARGEIEIPLRLRFRVRGLRQVAFEVGLRLQQRAFERPAIQAEQLPAFPHVVAFVEVHGGQLAGQLRANRDRRRRFAGADHLDVERHRLLLDDRRRHGNCLSAWAAAARRRCRRRLHRLAAGASRRGKTRSGTEKEARPKVRILYPPSWLLES